MFLSPCTIGTMPTSTQLAYIAGLFDGEGSVRLRFRRRRRVLRDGTKSPSLQSWYELETDISNKNRECLELCQSLYGGRIYETKNRKTPICHWRLFTGRAAAFLKDIRPYVIIKRPHLDAAFNSPEDKAYASRLLKALNTRGSVKIPLPLV